MRSCLKILQYMRMRGLAEELVKYLSEKSSTSFLGECHGMV